MIVLNEIKVIKNDKYVIKWILNNNNNKHQLYKRLNDWNYESRGLKYKF